MLYKNSGFIVDYQKEKFQRFCHVIKETYVVSGVSKLSFSETSWLFELFSFLGISKCTKNIVSIYKAFYYKFYI